jgi:hypothetical protein
LVFYKELTMDGELLRHLYHRLFESGSARTGVGQIYSDAIVALIYFFAVLSNRSPRWACDKRHWPLWARRLAFPSYSQLMRRLRQIDPLIAQLNCEFRARLPSGTDKTCDGKPLLVGGDSKDPDVRWGRIPGDGWALGYKLHLIIDESTGAIEAIDVTALDGGEATVARRLIRDMDLRGVTLRGDSNYDSNPLYTDVAQRGGRLIAPRKKPGTGLGHHRHHPDRLRAIAELEGDPAGMRAHRHRRIRVEQSLAHLTNVPFGLSPLPNCVRRLARVRRWVKTKVMLYHLYRSLIQDNALAA